MPIVEILGIVLAACGLPVIVMQHIEQVRDARMEANARAGGADH